MSRSLHVGIATLGYPPIRHVAGTRPSRTANELVRRGHRVSVVTVDWRPDPGTESRIEDGAVHVIRVNPREWFPDFDPNQRPMTLERPPMFSAVRRARTAARMLRWGPFAQWAKRATSELLARHARQPIDVVWAIHGDDSAHEVGFRFHRLTGVPWIADFKDPWDQFHPRGARWLQKLVTARRLETAFCMTHNGAEQAKLDEGVFGKSSHVIWTSYDHELLASVEPRRISDAFSICYIGHIGSKHDPNALAETLRRVHDVSGSTKVEFHVFGHETHSLRPMLRRAGVEHMLVAHSFVPQRDAYALMRGADALLLLPTANHKVGVAVGVKELEYFASGSPVVCVGRLLPEMQPVVRGLANVVQAEDPVEAARTIAEELACFRERTPSRRRGAVNPPELLAHTWPEKARALETILLNAAESRSTAFGAKRAG